MTRRRRRLSEEELSLWRHVTKDVEAFHPQPQETSGAPAPPVEAASGPPAPAPEPRRYEAAPYTPPQNRPKPATPGLAPIERPVRQRLARGRLGVDGKIDLHGLTQTEAHHALRHFLSSRQADGARIVLVVTGKGLTGGDTGVLRRMTPHWLAAPDWRRFVAGFEQAGRSHGGDGAFYVRLRRIAAP